VTDRTTATQPSAVPERVKQDGDIYDRWPWVEAVVWTPRMLTALETGIKGGKWFSLVDKVYAPANLYAAWARVRANAGAAGVDQQTIEMFEQHLATNLEKLSNSLRDGSYRPAAIRRVMIPKLGSREMRPLGIPTMRDRVVQTALRNVMEPIFERTFAAHSYGFRPGRGAKDALRRVNELLDAGLIWVVDADLKSYFDTIPHQQLRARVEEQVADGRVLELLDAFLQQDVLGELTEPVSDEPETGTPQGAVVSPLLANIYLSPLDHLMAERSREMVRYADDLVILCGTQAEAEEALREVEQWTQTNGLALHPTKTRIVNAAEDGFDFLGYHFERGKHWPRKKSLQKLKETIRVETRRNNGESLARIIERVNRTLRGWYEYFKHSNRWTFKPLDKWIRMRLRSILRRRAGKRGRGRGSDHQRWPNAYFDALGLFNLEAAHARECQSSQR
jgi:RNA-directed DNA polymerase